MVVVLDVLEGPELELLGLVADPDEDPEVPEDPLPEDPVPDDPLPASHPAVAVSAATARPTRRRRAWRAG